jgi:hypothetical protein
VQDSYVLLVNCLIDPNPDVPPTLAVVPDKLGPLKAGTPTSFSIVLPKPKGGGSSGWAILVFSEGRQLRSTGMGKILPAYFDRIDHISLHRRIEERVQKGVDAPLAAFRELPLTLPDALKERYHGKSIKVEIQVGASGTVESVRSLSTVDPEMGGALSAIFANWLFLPALKDHTLVSGTVIIPLTI